jgi:HD-GYP domain-containing protein (c-di-GMP phosphodiesterase class II)
MHDVGKQQSPEDILLKPGPLDERERAVIKRHAVGSEVTLDQLFPDSQIVAWAASHHEKLDGSGYPYGLVAADLDMPSRILTVSDIFQAMTQDRPYRRPMTLDNALTLIDGMVSAGELDRDVVRALKADAEAFYRLSAQ